MLKLLLHSPWLTAVFGRSAWADGAAGDPQAGDLLLLVDTLVPGDESPGAVDLGIHLEIDTSMQVHEQYRSLLVQGMVWLNRESVQRFQLPFAQLPANNRAAMLRAAEKSPRGTAQHQLFTVLRRDVLQRFYSRAESWPQLGYQGPPQPQGFTAYHQPPPAYRDS